MKKPIDLCDDEDLRYAEEQGGLSLKEIAERLGITPSGAQIAVQRAMDKAIENARKMGLEFAWDEKERFGR